MKRSVVTAACIVAATLTVANWVDYSNRLRTLEGALSDQNALSHLTFREITLMADAVARNRDAHLWYQAAIIVAVASAILISYWRSKLFQQS